MHTCTCCRLICFLGQSVFNLGQFGPDQVNITRSKGVLIFCYHPSLGKFVENYLQVNLIK